MKKLDVLFFGILLSLTYGYTLITDSSSTYFVSDAIYLLAPLVAAVLGVIAFVSFGGLAKRSLSLLLITIGLFSYLIGESVWFYIVHILQLEPGVSIADGFFLAAYPFFLAGILIEYQLNEIRLTFVQYRDWIVYVFGALALVIAYFSIFGSYSVDSGPLLNAVNIGYGIGDLILVIGVCLLLLMAKFGHGQLKKPWRWIVAGFTAMMLADLAYSLAGDAYYDPAMLAQLKLPIDIGWILSYVFVSQGMIGFIGIAREAQDIMSKLTSRSKTVVPQ